MEKQKKIILYIINIIFFLVRDKSLENFWKQLFICCIFFNYLIHPSCFWNFKNLSTNNGNRFNCFINSFSTHLRVAVLFCCEKIYLYKFLTIFLKILQRETKECRFIQNSILRNNWQTTVRLGSILLCYWFIFTDY